MENKIIKNSKSYLINTQKKFVSLKDNHFSKFLKKLNDIPYYNSTFDKNIQKIPKLHLYETNSKNNIHEDLYKNIFTNIRRFKSPKYINYNLRFKAPHFRQMKLDKEPNVNSISNYKKKMKSNNSNKILLNSKNTNDIYQANYDPIKISNNFINFFQNKEFSKNQTEKVEKVGKVEKVEKVKLNKLNNNNINKEKNKKDKINYKFNLKERKGYFGRKEMMGIPYLFDTYSLFNNIYSTKSEKSRHEIILNDLNKLKGFLQGNPNGKIFIFKDFLKKYKINNIEEFSDKKILSLCDILCNNDNDILIQFLKPYLNIRDMLIDLFRNLSSINDIKDSNDSNNNINNEPNNYNINNNIINQNKDKIYLLKEKSNSELINNLKDELLFKTKINKKGRRSKDSRNPNNFINGKINNDFSKTQKNFNNIKSKTFYKSPFFIPSESHYILYPKNQNVSKKKFHDLNDTNSLLKDINYQTKALGKRKEYSKNNDLLINDMSKEIKELENNYYKILIDNKENEYKSKTQSNFNVIKNKICSNSQKSIYSTKKDFKLNNNDIFCKTSIQFYNKNKIQPNTNKLNLQIISLKNDKIDKLKKCISNTSPSFQKKINKKTKSLNEINIRMYYRPIKFKFGYKQIKDQYKITEMAALNFAKKKKFDPMGLICNF